MSEWWKCFWIHVLNEKKLMFKIMKLAVQLDIIYVGGCGGHPMSSKFISFVKSQMSTHSEGNDTLNLYQNRF